MVNFVCFAIIAAWPFAFFAAIIFDCFYFRNKERMYK